MAYAHVASTVKGTAQNGGATDAISTTGADLFVVAVGWYSGGGATSVTVSDSAGNTWTPLTRRTVSPGANEASLQLFYCRGGTTSATHTFTASVTSGFPFVWAGAFSGSAASPFDQESGAGNASTTSVQPGSITPSENDCLVVGAVNFTAGNTGSVNGGFTGAFVNFSSGNFFGGGGARLIQTTAAAANPTFSWTTTDRGVAALASFKAGGGGGDTTAPVLTSPVGTATGTTTATIGATTDEGNGTLYGVVTTSGTAPSAAQVKAGQTHTGGAAAFAGSTSVASTGAKTIGATGLTANTGYYAHLMHEDAAANQSAVVSSAQFTTRNLIAVDDADVEFSPYNWRLSGSTFALTNNPGAYLLTKFTGTSFRLRVDVSALVTAGESAGQYPAIGYYVNGTYTRYQLTSSDTTLTLASGLSAGTHTLELVLVGAWWQSDRWTTPVQALKVTGFEVDGGSDVAAPDTYADALLLFGDSNCEGYEALGTGVTVANQDAGLSHALLYRHALKCEVGVVAFAGQGYTQTVAAANLPDLEDSWDFYSSGQSRLSGGLLAPEPTYLVSVQGQNDGGDVTATVTALIAAWRAAAPGATIFVGSPVNQSHASQLSAAVAAAADANCFWLPIAQDLLTGTGFDNGTHINGLRGHPRYAAMLLGGMVEDLVAAGGGGSGPVPMIGSPLIRSLQ